MKLKDAVLARNPRAWGRVADIVREHGGRYKDTHGFIRDIFRGAGKTPPDEIEFEEMMQEADDLASKEG